jgi:hypothetical protein
MDEFQAYSELNELEALKDIVPSFAKAQLEPFLSSAQQDVVPPVWDGVALSIDQTSVNPVASSGALIRCVIGVQEGGSFVPKLAFVTGPAEDIP